MNLYILLVLAVASHVGGSCWRELSYGTLLPRDSSYLVGSDVTLRCILLNRTMEVENEIYEVNSSMITFNTGNKRINTSDIQIVNDMEARLLIHNGSADDKPYYDCGIKLTKDDRPKTICPTFIYFGYPPANVTNFKCSIFNWNNLTCTWSVSPNPATVSHKLSYAIYSFYSMKCPKGNQAEDSCWWNLSTEPPYVRVSKNLYFFLNSSNDLGDINQTFNFSHNSIVIPSARQVLVTETHSRQVKLRFDSFDNLTPRDFPPGLCYKIKYKSNYEKDFKVEYGTNVTNYTINNLYPNTWYTLKVQVKSCAADTDLRPDLWSAVSDAVFTTKPDIPENPPEALNTFFDVVNSPPIRSVTVYWKRLEKKYENGDSLKYKVTLETTFVHRRRRSILNSRVTSGNSIQFQDLELTTAYLVRIWAVNNEGMSDSFTSITIPKNVEMPSRPKQVQPIFDVGRYEVSWVKPDKPIGNYTLIWCQGEPRCTKGLHWMEVSSDTERVELNLNESSYDFAVATTSDNGNLGSGLEWAPCTVYRTRVYRVRQIKLEEVKPRSVRVNWKLECEAQKAVVTHYLVYQCKCGVGCVANDKKCVHTCMGNVSKNVTNPQDESVVIDNLSPFTKYGFSIVAVSVGGQSMESEVVCVSTLSDAPSDPPHDVKYSDITNTTVKLFWRPPNVPNGEITNFTIYAKPVSKDASNERVYYMGNGPLNYSAKPFQFPLTGLKCFTNYSITVLACVKDRCSPPSQKIYVKTAIGVPGRMDPPQTTVINSSHVRVFWNPPFDANGPLDRYLLHQFKREADNLTRLDLLNVTGTSVEISSGCMPHVQTEAGWTHVFSVQAINLVPGEGEEILYGPISNTTETKLCFMGTNMNSTFVVGVIVGSTVALALVIFALYTTARWMKTKLDSMKDVQVELPRGLNNPRSYEEFKEVIKKQGFDPNMSPKMERNQDTDDNNDSNNSDDSFKNRHGSGTSQFSANSTDELLSKQSNGGQTAPRSMGQGGNKMNGKGERNPSGDSSSGHDSISSSLTHRTNLSTDGSTSGQDVKVRDAVCSRDSGLDEESKSLGGSAKAHPSLPSNKCVYLPATAYSKLGFIGGRPGDYFPATRGRHLSLYGQNLANSEPSITDLNQDPYTIDLHVPQDPPSPDVPYSKFGMSHSVTDLMLEGMETPDSPLSSNPSPQEALPYSRFGLRRNPAPIQKTPYVTMGMALLMGTPKDPTQLLSSKKGPPPLVLKTPSKKKQPPEVSTISDQVYSKLGLGSVVDQKTQPYLTMKEVQENKQNSSLLDFNDSGQEESPTIEELPKQFCPSEETTNNGYLPHQFIPSGVKEPEPALTDLVQNCGSIPSLTAVLQEMPQVKVQGSNGYVSYNQVLANNTSV